ncbi:MAG: DUF2066 domain-containing protein [Methyloligellaceae bacterium]
MFRCIWTVGALMAGLAAAPMPAPAQTPGVYVVAKLAVEAQAKDAVAAKRQALQDARQKAMRTLMKRITPFSAYERLPKVKSALIQDLLEGFSVRRERNSATRYLATLDFNFLPRAVRQLLTGYGIPFTDRQAPSIRVLPVYLSGGQIKTGRADVWRRSWLALDLSHALTPVNLAQPSPSLTPEVIKTVLSGDTQAYETLRGKYKSLTLVLAVAHLDDTDGRLVTQLFGFDQAGAISLLRRDRVPGGDLRAAAGRAAEVALRIFEGRWKVTKAAVGGSGGGDALVTVEMTVAFSGLQQWQDIRSRLARVPGVQALEILSLSARTADVAFQFAGGADRLGPQLATQNLDLQNAGSRWILRSR